MNDKLKEAISKLHPSPALDVIQDEIESLRREVEELKLKVAQESAKFTIANCGWDESIKRVAASQAREQMLREAAQSLLNNPETVLSISNWNDLKKALSTPPDNTALIAFADKVREEAALICDEHADDPVYCGDAIRSMKGKLP